MKEPTEIVLGKRLFASLKGQLYMTKGHLGHQEGHVKVKCPPSSEVVFETFDSNYKIAVFQKGHFVTKRPIPKCVIFLKYALYITSILQKIFTLNFQQI